MATSFILPEQANAGFRDASRYDQHRPSYPDVAVEKLLTHLGVTGRKNRRIIDLGCGTGKFTELLAARPEQFEVVAIEPHEEMRATLVKKNLGPAVKVLNGSAGSIPVEEDWGDALIAAQASHVSQRVEMFAHIRYSHFNGLQRKSP
jgi:trans-aconitate methyltransferase